MRLNNNSNKYSFKKLSKMKGKEFKHNPEIEIKISNTFIYDITDIKVRGVRGIFVFIDLFVGDRNASTITVSVYDILYVLNCNDRLTFDVIINGNVQGNHIVQLIDTFNRYGEHNYQEASEVAAEDAAGADKN